MNFNKMNRKKLSYFTRSAISQLVEKNCSPADELIVKIIKKSGAKISDRGVLLIPWDLLNRKGYLAKWSKDSTYSADMDLQSIFEKPAPKKISKRDYILVLLAVACGAVCLFYITKNGVRGINKIASIRRRGKQKSLPNRSQKDVHR